MKNRFKAFYDIDQDELKKVWEDEHTIFIFDTNVLLNLYSYSKESRDEFFSLLEKIKDRLWMPFHVALEYQRKRLDIIKNEKSIFSDIAKTLDNTLKKLESDFDKHALNERNPTLSKEKDAFKTELDDLVTTFKEKVKAADVKQPCVRSEDTTRNKLDEIYNDCIGNSPSQKWINELNKEGDDRFQNKIPPGYKDKNKDNQEDTLFSFEGIVYQKKFGDLIIWKQIIEYLKDNTSIKNVIFITDDTKEDWWQIIYSKNKKEIGARPELKSEIYKETDIDYFKMYRTSLFLTHAQEYIDNTIDNETIDEAKSVALREISTSKMGSLSRENTISIAPNLGVLNDLYDSSSAVNQMIATIRDAQKNIEYIGQFRGLEHLVKPIGSMYKEPNNIIKLGELIKPITEATKLHSLNKNLEDVNNGSDDNS